MEDTLDTRKLNNGEEYCMYLPPGFRFYPTDEEIITNYLSEKVTDPDFTSEAVGEADMNKCEPWDLPSKAKMGEKEWYFFCQKDRKYPTGSRTNRATASGYWKATGKDKEILKGKGELVGMKKTLVFYKGRAPNGEKTNWVMHEFRLEGSLISLNHHSQRSLQREEWVVCKIHHKGIAAGTNGSHIINPNSYHIEDPMIISKCHKPNMISANLKALTPLPDIPSFLAPAPDGSNMGCMHQQQLVQEDTKWYNNKSQLYDKEINPSDAMMDINWSF